MKFWQVGPKTNNYYSSLLVEFLSFELKSEKNYYLFKVPSVVVLHRFDGSEIAILWKDFCSAKLDQHIKKLLLQLKFVVWACYINYFWTVTGFFSTSASYSVLKGAKSKFFLASKKYYFLNKNFYSFQL